MKIRAYGVSKELRCDKLWKGVNSSMHSSKSHHVTAFNGSYHSQREPEIPGLPSVLHRFTDCIFYYSPSPHQLPSSQPVSRLFLRHPNPLYADLSDYNDPLPDITTVHSFASFKFCSNTNFSVIYFYETLFKIVMP